MIFVAMAPPFTNPGQRRLRLYKHLKFPFITVRTGQAVQTVRC